jgi:hypothetical protein
MAQIRQKERHLPVRSNSANPARKNQGKNFVIFAVVSIMKLDNLAAVFYLLPVFQRALASRTQAVISRSFLTFATRTFAG